MVSTYDFAEPGFILIDRVNEMNNNWWCENIRATNPCGEQPLPPYGACLLGSVNLTNFVRKPFTDEATFDWEEYKEVVRVFTRMLDNVVEVNGLPLQQQRDEIVRKRRHGMGFLGLGSTVTMLKMKYGSPGVLRVHRAHRPRHGRGRLGNGPGAGRRKRAPRRSWTSDFEVTAEMLRKRPEMANDGWKLGQQIEGQLLHAQVLALHAARGRRSPRNWWRSWPRSAPASPTTARSRRPAPSRCRWPTTPPTASSPASRTTTAAT